MALRRFLGLLRVCARGQRGMAAAAAAARGQRARLCGGARVRAIRAWVEAVSTDAVACAEARARASRAFLRRALLQADRAAGVAAVLFRQRSDQIVARFLRLAYGEMAPKTPSPLEILQRLVQLALRAKEIETYVSRFEKVLEIFDSISPIEAWIILAFILGPVRDFYQNIISTAPEVVCPFLGLRSIDLHDCTVEEGLLALLSLAATCGGMLVLYVGGLCICVCLDLGTFALGIVGNGSLVADSTHHSVAASTVTWSFPEGEAIVVDQLQWGPFSEEKETSES